MISYSYYEIDNRVKRYAETLVTKGWEVDVLSLSDKMKTSQYCLKGVNVYGIQKRTRNESNKLSYLLKILWFIAISALTLTKKHFKQKYNLIHIHSVPDFLVFAAIIPKFTGSKLILDIHDIVPELYCTKFGVKENTLIFKVLLFIEKLSTHFADHVIIANHIWHKKIINRSLSPKKCTVLLNYPDEKIFGIIKKNKSDEDFLLLYPGTLSKHQGIDVAIKAVAELKKIVPQIKFHIYGSGTDGLFLKQLTKSLCLSDTVQFFDPLPLEEIAQVMANADVGVEPKRNIGFSNEAFSTKTFEFMLLGVPVLVSDTDIHKYYLSPQSVQFFKAGDVNDFVNQLILLHNDKLLRNNLILNAKRFIRPLCWNNKEHEYQEIIADLLPQVSNSIVFPISPLK